MATYRIMLPANDHAHALDTFEADDDRQALIQLVLQQREADCELWYGSRLVATAMAGELPLPRLGRAGDGRRAIAGFDRCVPSTLTPEPWS